MNSMEKCISQHKLCSCCKETKAIETFSKKTCSKDGYKPYCKTCQKKKKQIYMSNASNREHSRIMSLKRSHNRSLAVKIIRVASIKCAICGVEDPNVLTLDHIEPDLKKRRKSGNKIGGLSSMPNVDTILNEFLSPNTRVLCSRCHHQHNSTQYKKDRYITPGRKKHRNYVDEKKKQIGKCSSCTFDDFTCTAVFHFDHLDPKSKVTCISAMCRYTNKEFIKHIDNEIAKCQLLCANCHFIRTRQQNNTYMSPQCIAQIKDDILQGKYDYLSELMPEIKKLIK